MFIKRNALTSTHPGVNAFDTLPDSANVPIQVVCTLFGCSTATIWRRVRSGHLIAPHRIGLRSTRWSVGDLRIALNNAKGGGKCL
jgi:predicted DNA-binding transcriptional regulator AlpA